MSKLLLVAGLGCALFFAGPCLADELTTTDGTRLNGTFDKLEAGKVHFTDASAGAVKIDVAKIAELKLDGEKTARIRRGAEVAHQETATIFTRDGELYVRAADGVNEAISISSLRGINEDVPDTRPLWSASLIGVFGWTDGNTKTYALGFRGEVKRETKNNYQGLYAEGNYLQDRNVEEQQVRRRDYALGYYYRYIFDFRLTIDFTQDFTFNELAGYHWRSVTALGPGYYIVKEDDLSMHVGAHLTYTYEDLMNGADDNSYWGARLRGELDWVSATKTTHVNFKTEVNFDFSESRNIVVNNTLLAETRPYTWMSAGLLVRHSWDNLPTPGFVQHDFSLTFTLGISWSGRWI